MSDKDIFICNVAHYVNSDQLQSWIYRMNARDSEMSSEDIFSSIHVPYIDKFAPTSMRVWEIAIRVDFTGCPERPGLALVTGGAKVRRRHLLLKHDSESSIGIIVFRFRSLIKDQRICISSRINLVAPFVVM
jgi:hypothetical protein